MTKPAFTPTPWVAGWAVGWDYKGSVSFNAYFNNCSGNHAKSCHYRYRNDKFQLILEGITLQTELPWISMNGYYNGAYVIKSDPG